VFETKLNVAKILKTSKVLIKNLLYGYGNSLKLISIFNLQIRINVITFATKG